jgi:hypothetical protein
MKKNFDYINIFIHVPKTGGSSFIENVSKAGFVCYSTNRIIPKNFINPEKCFIHGHKNISFFENICKKRNLKPIYYTLFRNPFKKRISRFNFGCEVNLEGDARFKSNLQSFIDNEKYKKNFFQFYINMQSFLFSNSDQNFNNQNFIKGILSNSEDDFKYYYNIQDLKSSKLSDINYFSKNSFAKISKINFFDETKHMNRLYLKLGISGKKIITNTSNCYLNPYILNNASFQKEIFPKFFEDIIIYLNFLQIKKKKNFIKFKSKKIFWELSKKIIFKKIVKNQKKINFDNNFLGFIKLSKLEEKCYKNNLPIDFDPVSYLHLNQDVKDANVDPFYHIKNYGILEDRIYKKNQNFSLKFNYENNLPLDFDEDLYLKLNPDVDFNAHEHYLRYGINENRRLTNFFKVYKINNSFYKKYYY